MLANKEIKDGYFVLFRTCQEDVPVQLIVTDSLNEMNFNPFVLVVYEKYVRA